MADDPRLDDDAPLGAREPPCRTGEPASTELRAATASLRAARLVSGVSGLAGSADDLTDEALRLPDACPLIADTAGRMRMSLSRSLMKKCPLESTRHGETRMKTRDWTVGRHCIHGRSGLNTQKQQRHSAH
ncbi:hypothetical protein [Qipengyuania flava]|uniref:hypothetical protein n=1 Tax=Qipengyuania flava TaxID=192812 RepID=UPI0027D7701B|nr:hypothetical protein [Qipengyuania flava]